MYLAKYLNRQLKKFHNSIYSNKLELHRLIKFDKPIHVTERLRSFKGNRRGAKSKKHLINSIYVKPNFKVRGCITELNEFNR